MPTAAPSVSFEFFPPRTDLGEEAFWKRVDTLAALKPAFMTMTYGAGGSAQNKTIDLAIDMARRTQLPTAAHLTSTATTKEDLKIIADRLWDNNVRHIVALRGDIPKERPHGYDPKNHFAFTSDFVAALKKWHPFEISVGAYPEKHPDAPDMAADIEALRMKCDGGATRAITQFFFDNIVFYRFRDLAAKAGISTPIVPGILPIVDYEKMLRFAGSCKATVPTWLAEKFNRVKGDDAAMKALAAELLEAQVRDLAAYDVPHMHLYTLNQCALPVKACRTLGIGAA